MIILNEEEYAQKLINEKSIGKNPFEDLVIVTKYYLGHGHKKNGARRKLEEFLVECDPNVSIPKASTFLDAVVSKALKGQLLIIPCVNIYKSEMEVITAIKSRMAQRLAFTLLCLSKYWDIKLNSDHWVNTDDGEIMKMANIKTSIRKQCELFRMLYEDGLIQFSKRVDNTNVRVLFQENDGVIVLKINDFRNLGWQYLNHLNGGFYFCQNCGVISKRQERQRRDPKYCPDCAVKIHLQQRVNSVMRIREKNNNIVSS